MVLLLQDPAAMDRGATNIAYLVLSTDRTGSRGPRSFEVPLDEHDGLSGRSVADGRWVFTMPRDDLQEADFVVTLSEGRMDEVSTAVFIGLQLDP
jgi:mRNA-degrading endonuclease toxin of MazEF toxin-antitoxin module